MNTKIIKLDINKNLYDILTAKQGDTQSRFLLFQLLDGAIPFSLENRSVKVFATKPDGKEVFNDLIINDRVKGYCTLELTNQMLAVPGLLKLELMVIEGDKKLTTNVFYMDVKKSINSENAIVSTNEFSALLNGLASLNEYDNYKNEIAAARDGEVNLLTKVKKIDEHLDTNTNNIKEIGKVIENINLEVEKDIEITTKSYYFSEKMKNQTIQVDFNLNSSITNFSFENLIKNYSYQNVNSTKTDIDVSNLEIKFTAIDTAKTVYCRWNISNLVANHKYYLSTIAKSTNVTVNVQLGSSSNKYAVTGEYQKYSVVNTFNSGSWYIGFAGTYSDTDITYIKKPLLIDLTEMYGEGNEPTLLEFEEIIGEKWAIDNYNETGGSSYHFTMNSYDEKGNLVDTFKSNLEDSSIDICRGGHIEIEYSVAPKKITLKNVIYPYNLVIEDNPSIEASKPSSKNINLYNVDRLLFVGDSYTEGMYYQKGKAWVCQLSEQLDYTCEGFGWGGNTCQNLADRINNNEKRYNSVGVRDLNSTKAMLMSFVNDMATGGTNSSVYFDGMKNLIQAIESMGCTPIPCTEFRNPWGTGQQIGLSALCNQNNLEFFNILPFTTFLGVETASDNTEHNWCFSGSHPGQRTGGIIFNNYLKFAKNLPRPNSAIKIYRLRDNIIPTGVSGLIYTSRRDKLLKFKEINISHSCLGNPNDWDNITNTTDGTVLPVNSEYGKLMANESVSFGNYTLIEVVLPSTVGNIEEIRLNIPITGHTIYVKTNKGFVSITDNKITKDMMNTCLELDKVTFLVYKDGGFSINDISIDWSGEIVNKNMPRKNDIAIKGIEKLTKNTFSDLTGLTIVGILTVSEPTNYTCMPTGCTKLITIDNTNYFKIPITKSTIPIGTINKARLRIVARYNPPIGDDSINENSYDRKEIEINIKGQNVSNIPTSVYSIKHEVDMSWTLCEFDIELNENTEIAVMSADTTPLEVCYISVLEI